MRIAVIGSSGGIGNRICKILAADHHDVYPSNSDVDVRKSSSIIKWKLERQEMDALVYAAGINHLDWSKKIDPAMMNEVLDINVTGLIRCLKAFDTLRRVVVIGSDAATRPMRTSVAYNASKAALHAAVKVIARERAESGFIINVVAPGLIAGTAMTDYVFERTAELRPDFDLQSYMIDAIPVGTPGKTTDVAVVVKWLLEGAPKYLNGAIIEVNGAR